MHPKEAIGALYDYWTCDEDGRGSWKMVSYRDSQIINEALSTLTALASQEGGKSYAQRVYEDCVKTQAERVAAMGPIASQEGAQAGEVVAWATVAEFCDLIDKRINRNGVDAAAVGELKYLKMAASNLFGRRSTPPAPDEAVEAEREACAKLVEPTGPRPCDCYRCDCGNAGDAEAVARWDAETLAAKAIRARSRRDGGGV